MNDRLKEMNRCKVMEKILVRNNPNKTGGHDPDVARHLLKTGRLPNRGLAARELPSFERVPSLPNNYLTCVPDTPLFEKHGVPPREYTKHEIPPRLLERSRCQRVYGNPLCVTKKTLGQVVRFPLHDQPTPPEPCGDGNRGGAEFDDRQVGGRLVPRRNLREHRQAVYQAGCLTKCSGKENKLSPHLEFVAAFSAGGTLRWQELES